MRKVVALLCGGLVVGLSLSACAAVLRVPSEYPTIQAGIDAAADGDTVLVADGTYTGDGNRDIDFAGKAIVVISENGPEVTVIDCGGSYLTPHRGFYFHSGEDSSSVLHGFTIRNGYVADGGGIYCSGSSPTIVGNTFIANEAPSGYGGGIACWSSSSPIIKGNTITANVAGNGGGILTRSSYPIIVGNTITGNTASYGGGIMSWSSAPVVIGNTITLNMAYYGAGITCYESSYADIEGNLIEWNGAHEGAGIFCYESASVTIEGNVIRQNVAAEGSGGGIYCPTSSSVTILGNRIVENRALWNGGGIGCVDNSSPDISGNTVTDNIAHYGGGGLYCRDNFSLVISGNMITGNRGGVAGGGGIHCADDSTLTISGNTIAGNTAEGHGGGIYCTESSTIISGNTIAENTGYNGGAVCCVSFSEGTVLNSILWGNSAVIGQEIYTTFSSSIAVTYSDVKDGWPGEGNIDADPVFVLAAAGDYRLLWESPCIDSGHPDSLDPDGTRADMGAHFFDQDDYLTLYLSPGATQVSPGDELGVLYTVINRREEPEGFWVISGVVTPVGDSLAVLGPRHRVIPGEYTAQVPVVHQVPLGAPLGEYQYWSGIGLPPSTLYDRDGFRVAVVEPEATRTGSLKEVDTR